MKRTISALIVLAAFAALPMTAWAQIGDGFAAGLAVPQGELGKLANAGFQVTGLLTYSLPLAPVGFRGEASWTQFNYKGSGKARILSATANTVFASPGIIGPYLIGGIGIYNASAVCNGCTSNGTRGGINAGAGFKFGLGGLEAFVEARYHYIPGPMDATTAGIKGTSTTFIPLSIGLSFR